MTEILSAVSPSVFSWTMLGRGPSAVFVLPRPEKGALWPTPCRTRPARVAVVALVLTGLLILAANVVQESYVKAPLTLATNWHDKSHVTNFVNFRRKLKVGLQWICFTAFLEAISCLMLSVVYYDVCLVCQTMINQTQQPMRDCFNVLTNTNRIAFILTRRHACVHNSRSSLGARLTALSTYRLVSN